MDSSTSDVLSLSQADSAALEAVTQATSGSAFVTSSMEHLTNLSTLTSAAPTGSDHAAVAAFASYTNSTDANTPTSPSRQALPTLSDPNAQATQSQHSQPQQHQHQHHQSQDVHDPRTHMQHFASPAASMSGNALPTCQNCNTSTTPLWRRDEYGSVLCNACGLFLKLHGRARPISLKTDVIKSRNRLKTGRNDLRKKTQPRVQPQQTMYDPSNMGPGNNNSSNSNNNTNNNSNNNNNNQDRRTAGKSPEDSRRFSSQAMYTSQSLFTNIDDSQFTTAGLGSFSNSARPVSPMSGDRSMDTPQSHDQMVALISSLRTRVSELELINELFRGRLSQLAEDELSARQGQELSGQTETQLRNELEESRHRENSLLARIEDLEQRLSGLAGSMPPDFATMTAGADAVVTGEDALHAEAAHAESLVVVGVDGESETRGVIRASPGDDDDETEAGREAKRARIDNDAELHGPSSSVIDPAMAADESSVTTAEHALAAISQATRSPEPETLLAQGAAASPPPIAPSAESAPNDSTSSEEKPESTLEDGATL